MIQPTVQLFTQDADCDGPTAARVIFQVELAEVMLPGGQPRIDNRGVGIVLILQVGKPALRVSGSGYDPHDIRRILYICVAPSPGYLCKSRAAG